MSGPGDVIERLGGLAARDREWIVRHLSPEARARLRERTAHERAGLPPPTTPHSAPAASASAPGAAGSAAAGSAVAGSVTAHERALEDLEGAQVAAALAGEPAWVLATLLGLRAWPWETQVLERVPPLIRIEVSRLRLGAPRIRPAMRELLLTTLCGRGAAAAEVSLTGFERLLHSTRLADRAHR